MSRIEKLANLYVASLRAIYLIEQHCHWQTRGDNFYGSHLLFERLYKQSTDDSDTAAERFIGLFGEGCVDYKLQSEFVAKLMNKYQSHAEEPLRLALAVEEDFVAYSQQCYDAIDKEGVLTLGLDDMIMSIASNHETSIYLLQQTLAKAHKE